MTQKTINLSGVYSKLGHNHDNDYAAKTHTHDYAASNHNHDTSYAGISHTHSGYAASNHTHSEYAAFNHTHSGYALSDHTHSGYASSSHSHGWQIYGDSNITGNIMMYNPDIKMCEWTGYVGGLDLSTVHKAQDNAITMNVSRFVPGLPQINLYSSSSRPGVTVELVRNTSNNSASLKCYNSETYGSMYVYYHFLWSYT